MHINIIVDIVMIINMMKVRPVEPPGAKELIGIIVVVVITISIKLYW